MQLMNVNPLCRIVPKAQYAITKGHCSIQLGVWGEGGAVSSPAGPGQSTGGGEAHGSSEKFAFYSTKKRPKNTCVVHFINFSVLNTIIKKLSDTIGSLI